MHDRCTERFNFSWRAHLILQTKYIKWEFRSTDWLAEGIQEFKWIWKYPFHLIMKAWKDESNILQFFIVPNYWKQYKFRYHDEWSEKIFFN